MCAPRRQTIRSQRSASWYQTDFGERRNFAVENFLGVTDCETNRALHLVLDTRKGAKRKILPKNA